MWITQIHWRCFDMPPSGDTHLAVANEAATSSGVCSARNAVFLAEANIHQTSTQDEVNGENLQRQKKHESVHTTILKIQGFIF